MALLRSWRNNLKNNCNEFLSSLDLYPAIDGLLSLKGITYTQYCHVKDKTPHREQILLLLDIIHDGPDSSVQAFVSVLTDIGQPQLSSCVTGMGKSMSWEHKDRLQHRRAFSQDLDLSILLDCLQSKGAITCEDKKRIKDTDITRRCSELLDLLMRKPDPVFYMMIDALKETNQPHLAGLLQDTAARNLSEENETLWQIKEKLERNLQDKTQENARLQTTIDGLQQEKSELETKVKEIEEDIKVKNEVIQRLSRTDSNQQIEELHAELDSQHKANANLERQFSNKSIDYDSQAERLKQMEKKLCTLDEEVIKEREDKLSLEGQLKEYRRIVEPPQALIIEEPELDFYVNDEQLEFIYSVTALPDGGALVYNLMNECEHQVIRIDKEGRPVPPLHVCKEDSAVSGILYIEGLVYILQYNGTITKCMLTNLSEIVDTYKLEDSELMHGDLLNEHTILLTDPKRGDLFSFDTLKRKKEVIALRKQHKGLIGNKWTNCKLQGPVSVACRSVENGKSYAVSEWGAHHISVYNNQFQMLKTLGREGEGDGQIDNPCCAVWLPWGNILVADQNNHRVCEFNPEKGFVRHVITEEILFPRSLSYCHPKMWIAGNNGELRRYSLYKS